MKNLNLNAIIIFTYIFVAACINAQAKGITTAELVFSGNVTGEIIPCNS